MDGSTKARGIIHVAVNFVFAISCAALAVSSIATAVSLIAPRSLSARAASLISFAVSRVASDASLNESTSSSTAPLWRIAITSSLILMDSSLILRAIPLIVSAVCCASTDAVMWAVVSVVEVFPLTLLTFAALLSSEGIVGVTIQTYHLPPLKEILSKIYIDYSELAIDEYCFHTLSSILITSPLFKT